MHRPLAFAAAVAALLATASAPPPQAAAQPDARRWWKEAVVYQIYPRSFADSDGDGVGDLNGITARLDHLKRLGVDVVWLSPHFDSPNADNGYDIRDYRRVMAEFGTMADFDRMHAGLKARGIRLIIDLVVNHTSDEHRWFAEARKGPTNPYRDYYLWRPGRNGGPPNNYPSFFGPTAWSRATPGGEYYLHLFAPKQPDLNWDNPKVRAEVYDVMRFWLDKGVAGFRMDVIPLISKDPAFPDLSPAQRPKFDAVYANGPRVHRYLREMRREVLSKYDAMTVGEAIGVSNEQGPLFVSAARGELDMIFRFDAVNVDRDGWRTKAWALPELKAIFARLDRSPGPDGWPTAFIGNHDKPRAVSHLGDGSPASARALATMTLTQRGTAFMYQGDELGMTNYPFTRIGQYDDILARNQWRDQVLSGRVPAAEFLPELAKTSRDNARTPMQWDATANAGFTTGKPWLAVNPNHKAINAAAQEGDRGSTLNHYRRLIALRARTPALVYGAYADIAPDHPRIYAFTRTLGAERTLTVINFSGTPARWSPLAAPRAVLVDSHGRPPKDGALAPWQATVYRL